MYNTDSSVIRHVVNLLEQIWTKYLPQSEDVFTLAKAKRILLDLAKRLENEQHN